MLNQLKRAVAAAGVALLFAAVPVRADTTADLTALLHEFLVGVDQAAVHDRFWAEDLVYTSSRGTRTTKADIMRGFANADDAVAASEGPVYTAEDIRVREYGETAVVAFRLVATGADGRVQQYFNTGTFAFRNGSWQVVAWQATQILPE